MEIKIVENLRIFKIYAQGKAQSSDVTGFEILTEFHIVLQ